MKGFGSKDAHRRDEFASEIRCSQYREGIKKELDMSKKFLQSLPSPEKGPESTNSQTWSGTASALQYDIGRTRVTEFDPKARTDQYYKLALHSEKNFGTYRPVSCDIGDVANNITYKPPKYGSASLVKVFKPFCTTCFSVINLKLRFFLFQNFYDQSHLKVRGVSGGF